MYVFWLVSVKLHNVINCLGAIAGYWNNAYLCGRCATQVRIINVFLC